MHFSLLTIPLSLLAIGSQAMPATRDGHPSEPDIKRYPMPIPHPLAARGDRSPMPVNNTDNGLYKQWNCNWVGLDQKGCAKARKILEEALAHDQNQVQTNSCTSVNMGGATALYCVGLQEGSTNDLISVPPGTLPAVWEAVRGNCGGNEGGVVGVEGLWAAGYLDTKSARTFIRGSPLEMKL
ncbi:hypothetical protein PG987_013115 [Apiospora arundinis]